MAKKTNKPKKLAGGTEKIPAPSLKMVSKTVGLLSTPIHVPEQSMRLPDNPSEYSVSSYPSGRPLSNRELQVKRLHDNGLSPVRISIGTGIRLAMVYSILGLDTDTKDFEKDLAELEQIKRI